MRVIQAPQRFLKPMIFLGGSISGARDWQSEVIKSLKGYDVIVFNPRRDNFDTLDPDMEVQQIAWEYRHLRLADLIVFWFSGETLAPITLFELGRHSGYAGRNLIVGVDPDYKRKRDVTVQLQLVRPDINVLYSFEGFIFSIQHWIKN